MATIMLSSESIEALRKFAANIEQPQSNNNGYAYDQAFCAWCKDNPVFDCKLEKFSSNEKPTAKVTKMPFRTTTKDGAEIISDIVTASPEKLQMFGTATISIPEFNSGKSVNLKMSVATAAGIFGLETAKLRATVGEITIGNRKGESWVSVNTSEQPNWEKFLEAVKTDVNVNL